MIFPLVVPELKTPRLLLRAMHERDFELFDEIVRFPPERGPRTAREVFEQNQETFRNRQCLTWVLDLEGALIGTCGFYRGFAEDRGEVGYIMRSDFRRRGYMSEVLDEVIRYGFKEMKLREISAFTKPENEASVKLLLGKGFEPEDEFSDGYQCHLLRAKK